MPIQDTSGWVAVCRLNINQATDCWGFVLGEVLERASLLSGYSPDTVNLCACSWNIYLEGFTMVNLFILLFYTKNCAFSQNFCIKKFGEVMVLMQCIAKNNKNIHI